MEQWTMVEAKKDFERGLLKSFAIEASIGGTWSVSLNDRLSMNGWGFLVDARRKEPRLFTTLDAAVSALRQIGFQVDVLEMKRS